MMSLCDQASFLPLHFQLFHDPIALGFFFFLKCDNQSDVTYMKV